MVVLDHASKESEYIGVDNAPRGYLDKYHDLADARRDPVMQHCKVSGLPIVWNQDTYIAASCGEMWEAQAPYGYKNGIAVALHLPLGRHFLVGFDRERPLPNEPSQLTRMVADLQFFTVLAHEAAFRVLTREATRTPDVGQLTHRELECLRWTMEGKTAWEVGRILRISEQTAVRHVNNSTHKLGCINKHQAVS
jgi:DNA-binding CsgD family transcriptional regulator